MREVLLPLVVIALIATALVARRVLRPMLSTFIGLCAAVSVIAYASLEVFPWVRGLSFFQPVRVQVEPQASFGALADGQPTEIAVQVFRGAQLLDERRIPGLGSAVTPPAREPLRLKPLDSGRGFQVVAGTTVLGELSGEAVAEARRTTEVLPDVASELPEGPPDAKPEIDLAEGEISSTPDGAAPEESASAPAPEKSARPRAASPAKRRPGNVRRTVARAQPSEADREVALRSRASELSLQGKNCEAERLLSEQGRDERSAALARELAARCRWSNR